jgi:hypothetical protein
MAECLCSRPCGNNCKCKCHDKRAERRGGGDLIEYDADLSGSL